MFSEMSVTGMLKLGGAIIAVAGPVIWQGGVQIGNIANNSSDLAELRQEYNDHEGDAIDRLGRIETKIDILMEKK